MLKIKDNVDLKELEKYGFKPRYDVDTGELVEMYRINGHYSGGKERNRITATVTKKQYFEKESSYWKNKNWWNIFTYSRKILPRNSIKLDVEDYDILYDLIKADLVEKVEEVK